MPADALALLGVKVGESAGLPGLAEDKSRHGPRSEEPRINCISSPHGRTFKFDV